MNGVNISTFESITIIVVIIGWAFNLGILWHMSRNHETRLANIETRLNDHHEDTDKHTSKEWRDEIKETLGNIQEKIDQIQRQCMERVSKSQC